MFTDNPKATINQGNCIHRSNRAIEMDTVNDFCFRVGECEGWRVWQCNDCNYVYFDTGAEHNPIVTLSDALQAYNWALKSKNDEPLSTRAMLLRLVINYMGEHRVDREHALLSIRAVLNIIEQECEGE